MNMGQLNKGDYATKKDAQIKLSMEWAGGMGKHSKYAAVRDAQILL